MQQVAPLFGHLGSHEQRRFKTESLRGCQIDNEIELLKAERAHIAASSGRACAYCRRRNREEPACRSIGPRAFAGALVWTGTAAQEGFLVLSSRVSIEMVQKTAFMGAPIIVAVSAPTARAVRACESAGITLVAVARQDGFEVFTYRRDDLWTPHHTAMIEPTVRLIRVPIEKKFGEARTAASIDR
jgi:FdhD/NarQ family